jgi:hypothetical protein
MTGIEYFKKIKTNIYVLSFYLFLKYQYKILCTSIYLRSVNLNSEKLRIILKSRNPIQFPSFTYPVLNTSIAALNGNLVAVARISNAGFADAPDLCGRPIQPYRQIKAPLENGIIKFELSFNGKISNVLFLHDISLVPNYEDPRIFFVNGQSYVVMTKVSNPPDNTELLYTSNVVVENLNTKQIIDLPSPYGKKIEKNWVPVEDNKDITLLYRSNPVTLIKIKDNKSIQKVNITQYKSTINLNNRTQVIKTTHPDIPYIRVVSKKFATRRYGYTPLHYFEILSENFMPIKLSRPFVFSSRRQEYCQGIALINSQIYLSWSEQEKYNFIGSIDIEEVIKLF